MSTTTILMMPPRPPMTSITTTTINPASVVPLNKRHTYHKNSEMNSNSNSNYCRTINPPRFNIPPRHSDTPNSSSSSNSSNADEDTKEKQNDSTLFGVLDSAASLTLNSPAPTRKVASTDEDNLPSDLLLPNPKPGAPCVTVTDRSNIKTVPTFSHRSISERGIILKRQESEPVKRSQDLCCNTNNVKNTNTNNRRSIFNSFWESTQKCNDSNNSNSNDNTVPVSTGTTTRKRAQSLDLDAHYKMYGFRPPAILIMPPPPPPPQGNQHNQAIHERSASDHSSIYEHLMDDKPWLPTLPTPLQRLQKHSGVYPLNKPKSILRNAGEFQFQQNRESAPQLPFTDSFNLTRTLHQALEVVGRDIENGEGNDEASSTSSTTTNSSVSSCTDHSHRVHFDPRIVVTELAEDAEMRRWYNEFELEQFKNDTIDIAREYLQQHPEEIASYSQPTLCPVTNKLRKKALFSMPALNQLSQDELEGKTLSASAKMKNRKRYELQQQQRKQQLLLQQQQQQKFAQSLFTPIRRILIVDRNDKILNLFCRSLRTILDEQVIIRCAKTGEEALEIINESSKKSSSTNNNNNKFDLIIAEERLYRPLPSILSSEALSTASMSTTSTPTTTINQQEAGTAVNHEQQQQRNTTTLQSVVSVPNMGHYEIGNPLLMSGSDLFKKIPYKDQCVLVGVSTHPDIDACKFANIADFLWTIPPPKMDATLRGQLLTTLTCKRKRLQQNNKK